MKITVYSDGSAYKKKRFSVSTSLLLTEKSFLNLIVKEYDTFEASKAEILAVLQALEYIEKNNSQATDVEVLVDAEGIVNMYYKLLSLREVPQDTYNKDIWEKILVFSKKYNLILTHVKGHQFKHNPNKVCDIVGRVYGRCGMVM
jgi:ribonuclease HI